MIALKTALEQQARIKPKMTFFFVERQPDRADMLSRVTEETVLPSRFSARVAGNGTFEEEVTSFLDSRTRNGQRLPPTFAFIDPFGWSGVPFELVRRILSFPSCEVLVTFMYKDINRFIGLPDQGRNFNSFFGTGAWQPIISERDPKQRNRRLHDLYVGQLKDSAKVQYVRSFEMRNEREVTDYYLFYATNSVLGLKKMKEAMWRVDNSGEFRFSDATDPHQQVFFVDEPQFDILRDQVIAKFQGGETTIGQIEQFVVSETAFRETHYKKQVLKPLELAQPPGLVPIDPPTKRRPGTYPDQSQRVRFI